MENDPLKQNAQNKVNEYIDRIKNGESKEKVLQNIKPGSWIYNEVQKGIEDLGSSDLAIEKEQTNIESIDKEISASQNTEVSKNEQEINSLFYKTFKEISEWKKVLDIKNIITKEFSKNELDLDLSGYPIIPQKYESLIGHPEVLEDIWTFAIPIDEKEYELLKVWKKRGIEYSKQYAARLESQKNLDLSQEVKPIDKSKTIIDTNKDGIEKIAEQEIILPNITRETNIHAVGDLNGSFESFVEHLKYKNLISVDENNNINWTGDNNKVVFIGDILGDRSPEGMKVYENLQNLKKQAELSGGNVEWLSGNHENMFNAILCGFTTEKGKDAETDMYYRLSGYVGNLELLKMIPEQEMVSILKIIENDKDVVFGQDFDVSIQKKKNILSMMKNNPTAYDPETIRSYEESYEDLLNKSKSLSDFSNLYNSGDYKKAIEKLFTFIDKLGKKYQNKIGEQIIKNRNLFKDKISNDVENTLFKEAFLNQKLISINDDSLYIHTSLTPTMVKIIQNFSKNTTIENGINKINNFYQNILKVYLENNNPEEMLSKEQINYFNILRDEFISTSAYSRNNFSESNDILEQDKFLLKDFLKQNGINVVIHGHTDEGGKPKGFEDLPIISIDRSVYNDEKLNIKKTLSYSQVSTTGLLTFAK